MTKRPIATDQSSLPNFSQPIKNGNPIGSIIESGVSQHAPLKDEQFRAKVIQCVTQIYSLYGQLPNCCQYSQWPLNKQENYDETGSCDNKVSELCEMDESLKDQMGIFLVEEILIFNRD